MQAVSYKDYLEVFSRYHQKNIAFSKIFFILVVVVFFTVVASFGISDLQNKQQEPARAQTNYFETANSSFVKAQQSLDDLFSSFQIAGAKIEKINDSKESTPSPGFFVALSETQKTISKIEQSQENLAYQTETLKKLEVPSIYSDLNTQISEYFNEADSVLMGLKKMQIGLKDLLVVTGPSFYFPVLSDETVWQSQDIEKIKAYYENKKLETQKSLENFEKIPTSKELKPYKEAQLTFYHLLFNVSDNIVIVLKKADSKNPDNSLVTEEAYQVLTGAKRENEYIAAKLLEEKIKFTSSEEYFTNVNKLNNRKKVIESGFQSAKVEEIKPPPEDSQIINLSKIKKFIKF